MRLRLWVVAALYVVIAIAMTWPIAVRLGTDLPGDLGDPAFVSGVIAWGAEHWLALLGGDIEAPMRFWHAPIFHPEPFAIAYSEHFVLHALVALPVYAITRNPVLCYNLAFMLTFVIGAVGMYVLVQDLTGQQSKFSPAAFVAGLVFAFAPYRVAQVAHLQVLSSHWMPYVLLGVHRYFRDGQMRAGIGAAAALWAQNLSSGYYMVFFAPFVALFTLIESAMRGTWRRLSTWRDLGLAGALTLAATLPFALPYLARTRSTRPNFSEVVWFSADLSAWLTASPLLNVWGHLQTLVKPEGALFPGATVVVLALVGVFRGWRTARVVVVFAAATVLLSFWLSLGPQVQLDTQPTGFPSLYQLVWDLPGFNAARVPARFAMLTVLALALLAGIALERVANPRRQWIAAVCGLLILIEGAAFPLPTNGTWSSAPEAFAPPPSRLYRLRDAPGAFRQIPHLDPSAVILHLPFGLAEREIQYTYYAMLHGRRIVNGYSGAFPATYRTRLAVLQNPFLDPPSVRTLLDSEGVTHAIVHTSAYIQGGGPTVVELLEKLGWKRSARYDDDYLLTR